MRYHFSLFVIFSVGLLVLAAPVTYVKKEDVQQGNIYWTRVQFVDHNAHLKDNERKWNHPVVVVSDVDDLNRVKVAPVSHHPIHQGPVHPASDYADLKGSISVGPPKEVKVKYLKIPTNGVDAVRPGRLQPLINSINANCPADKQLPGCEPSGSAEHNTEHGRPEHDNSKQGSQQGSSNKGSSSQSSRPGSTMQSSQKNEPGGSKQGSQADSLKQGSRPGSPDDGWQVVTSRRKNKAPKK